MAHDLVFLSRLREFVQLDEQKEFVEKELRHINQEKRKVQKWICTYLVENHLENKIMKLNDGQQIQYVVKNTKMPLNMEYLRTTLADLLEDPEQITDVLQYIESNRGYRTSVNLMRKRQNSYSDEETEDEEPAEIN